MTDLPSRLYESAATLHCYMESHLRPVVPDYSIHDRLRYPTEYLQPHWMFSMYAGLARPSRE